MKTENAITVLQPSEKIGKELFKLAEKAEKQRLIDSAVGEIQKEMQDVRTCDYELERWEKMRARHVSRIEALRAGEFALNYRGAVEYKDKSLQ